MSRLPCRFCSTPLEHTFADLGMSPLANSYLSAEDLHRPERFYPLHAWVCSKCFLVQLAAIESPEAIFSDYAYFASYSDSWLEHARGFAENAVERFALASDSLVVEIASNDGYLLQYFQQQGVPVLGVESAGNVARAAEERGIPTLVEFFGAGMARRLADEGRRADLLVGWNVFAHTPHLNDFATGLETALAPGGVAVLEFPHLLRLIESNQFDTIYHEHYSYFSFTTAVEILAAHGLSVFDVEEQPTHGGSLRLFACREDDTAKTVSDKVGELAGREEEKGLRTLTPYLSFGERVKATKRRLLSFLVEAKDTGKTVAGYGAPAKGNTLLNYCGLRGDFLDYTVDRSPHKQGRYLPGTHVPIHSPDRLRETKPDLLLILPWNLRAEIMGQMKDVREWGGRFLVPIPEVEVFE